MIGVPACWSEQRTSRARPRHPRIRPLPYHAACRNHSNLIPSKVRPQCLRRLAEAPHRVTSEIARLLSPKFHRRGGRWPSTPIKLIFAWPQNWWGFRPRSLPQIATDMLGYQGDNVARATRTVTRQIITRGIPGRAYSFGCSGLRDSCRWAQGFRTQTTPWRRGHTDRVDSVLP